MQLLESVRPARVVVLAAEPLDDPAQQGQGPGPVEDPLRGQLVGGLAGVPALGVEGVDGERGPASAPLRRVLAVAVVGQLAGADGAEERAEAAPRRVGHGDQVALEDVGEEVLGQVLRLLRRVSAVPDVGVDGIPVRLAEARQRLPGLRCVAAGGRDHATPMRRGKPARDVTVGLKSRHSLPRRGAELVGLMLRRTHSIIASRGGGDESSLVRRRGYDGRARLALAAGPCGSTVWPLQARFDDQLSGQLRRRRIAAKDAASEGGPYNEGLNRMDDQIPDTVPERRQVLPAGAGLRCRGAAGDTFKIRKILIRKVRGMRASGASRASPSIPVRDGLLRRHLGPAIQPVGNLGGFGSSWRARSVGSIRPNAQGHRLGCLETKDNGHPSTRHLHDGRCSRFPLL